MNMYYLDIVIVILSRIILKSEKYKSNLEVLVNEFKEMKTKDLNEEDETHILDYYFLLLKINNYGGNHNVDDMLSPMFD